MENHKELSRERSWRVTPERVLLVLILLLQLAILYRPFRFAARTVGTDPADATPISSSGVASKASSTDAPLSGVAMPEDLPVPEPPSDAFPFREHMDAMLQHAMAEFEQMERLVSFDEGWGSLMTSPTMDMRDCENDYVVVFSLPGLDESDIEVTLDGRLLTVSCSADVQTPQASHFGGFVRNVWLPGPVGDRTGARAVMTNGVLRVLIPKAAYTQVSAPPTRIF